MSSNAAYAAGPAIGHSRTQHEQPGDRQSQVPVSMKRLEEEILAIGSAVDRITSRLEPVLRITPPSTSAIGPQSDGPPAICPLACFIEERSRSLSRIREMLSDLENRIEL